MNESNDLPTRQCSNCKEVFPLTNEYFYRAKSYPSGLGYLCKPCARYSAKAYAAASRARNAAKWEATPIPHDASQKRCQTCKRLLPGTLEFFYRNKTKIDGLMTECKLCSREHGTRWARENREKHNASDAKYRLTKRGQAKAKTRLARWAEENPERAKAKSRRWAAENPDKRRSNEHKRRAKKRQTADNFTPEDWQFALDYFGGCCAVCGRPAGLFHTLAMDHWVPLASPDCPGHIPANVVPLCHNDSGCNNKKLASNPEKWLIDTFGKRKGKAIVAKIQEFFSKVRQV